MKPEEIKTLHKEAAVAAFDSVMQEKLLPIIDERSIAAAQKIVQELRLERAVFGKDRTGLSEKTKKDFVEVAKAALSRGMVQIDTKANEALIEEQDNRGGYLVSREIADALVRIAASVGTIMNQAAKWEMSTDELAVPN